MLSRRACLRGSLLVEVTSSGVAIAMLGHTNGIAGLWSHAGGQFLIWAKLFTVAMATKCAYRGQYDQSYTPEKDFPLGFGVRDCRWGCCWHQHHDVCCPFPQEVVVTAVVSVLASLLVITALVILVCYMVVKRRTDFHGEFKDLLLCCRPDPGPPTVALYTAAPTRVANQVQEDSHVPYCDHADQSPPDSVHSSPNQNSRDNFEFTEQRPHPHNDPPPAYFPGHSPAR